jgi:hypothetical protein
LPKKENPNIIEQLINSGDLWLNPNKTTSLRFMMS